MTSTDVIIIWTGTISTLLLARWICMAVVARRERREKRALWKS